MINIDVWKYPIDKIFFQIESKAMVGFSGVIIVVLAVCASVGFYGYCGVPATLFVIEVFISVSIYQYELSFFDKIYTYKKYRIRKCLIFCLSH